MILGRLGEFLKLAEESASVSSVVLLFLPVELEGAIPESLLTSFGNRDRSPAVDERKSGEVLGRSINLGPSRDGGGGMTVIGIGGFAALVSS